MITTIGIFKTHTEAESAISALKAIGIDDEDMSYIYKNKDGDVKDAQTGEKVGEGAKDGAATGAVVGAIAGLVVANGILPGIGTLFVAGPLAAALGLTGGIATTVAGAATGAVAGGLIGAMTNLGIDKEDAAIYEEHVRTGDVVLIARTDMEGAMPVFEDEGAIEVREYRAE